MRAGVFVSLGLSGVIPMLHTIIKNGPQISFGEGQIHWLILMALIYIFGATFYATRFPECKWPGRFDLVFQSHQIFHVMVVVAALGKPTLQHYQITTISVHMYGISNLQYYRWRNGATCLPNANIL